MLQCIKCGVAIPALPRGRPPKFCDECRIIRAKELRLHIVINGRRCPGCGAALTHRQQKCDECRSDRYKPRPLVVKSCATCHRTFETRLSKKKYCQPMCRPWTPKRSARRRGWIHTKAARELRAAFRDGDICRKCGDPMFTWERLDAGHSDIAPAGPDVPPDAMEHARCNRSAGATAGNRARR